MNSALLVVGLLALTPGAAAAPALPILPTDLTTALEPIDSATASGEDVAEPDLPRAWKDPLDAFLPNWSSPDAGRALRLSFLSFYERAGGLPLGTLDALETPPAPDAPRQNAETYRWARQIGDLDGDAVNDLVVQQVNHRTLESQIVASSGRDGHVLWSIENGLELQQRVWPRFGDSFANAPQNALPASDLNDDGVEDVLAFHFDFTIAVPPPGIDYMGFGLILIDASIRAHDGRTGQALWTEPIPSTIAWESYDPAVLVYKNFPTGWTAYHAPDGPRVLYKTTDIVQHLTMDPVCFLLGSCIFWVSDIVLVDHVKAFDARDKDHVIYARDLLPTDDPKHAAFTWLTGVADLGRGDEPDAVLDQWLLWRPQYSEYGNPLTGEPINRYGRAMRVLALNGDTGATLWSTLVFEEAAARVNAMTEEPFEELAWTGGQILGDLNDDGIADPLALYLTVDAASPGTTNGMFRTHFIPLDGQSGIRAWDDAKYQGWGFGASLATPGHNPKLLAIGTVDFLTGALPGGKFPPKDVHLAVLSLETKLALWDYSFRYPQDGGLSYQLTLHQYAYSLAPQDWDLDGVLDLVTPAQYVKPTGANQTLMAETKHTYEILSGATREQIYAFGAWGPSGVVESCNATDGELNLIVGHSRRVDLVTVNVSENREIRHEPLYFDPRPRPASAPVNLINLGLLCDQRFGRELFSVNLETFMLGHDGDGDPVMDEMHSIVALFDVFGQPDWIDPPLPVEVPLTPVLELKTPKIQTAAWWEGSNLLLAPAGLLPGITVGVALRAMAVRRRRNGGDAS